MTACGRFATCRHTLKKSVLWGRPEVTAFGENDATDPR
jgi:hypothetical protein